MQTAFRGALAYALAAFALNAAAQCDKGETLIGEDAEYYYCMKARDINSCRSKGGDVAKCIRSGCVRTAGVQLKEQIGACKSRSEACLHERGAPASLIEAISGCIVGTAVTGNLGGCFVGKTSGAIEYDTAVASCKTQFGTCVEPGLEEHKAFVAACENYRR
jgi:hypothetical protein